MCLGGQWNRKAKAHVFETNPGDLISEIIDPGEVTDLKEEFQFFQTPIDLAWRMVAWPTLFPFLTATA